MAIASPTHAGMADRFDTAIEELTRLDDASDLTGPVLVAIPMSGVAVSTLGGFLGPETVSASDALASRLDELQFDLGEGPCWDAVTHGSPVFEPDIRDAPRRRWTTFSEALSNENVGALFAFPLSIGPTRFGALDLYNQTPVELEDEEAKQAGAMAAIISRHVLRRAMRLAGELEHEGESRHSRRAVHQATGFVIAQLGVSPEDAHLLIQGHALARERSMNAVAEDIIARRLTFTVNGNRIEDDR
jgi:hypothetical protein